MRIHNAHPPHPAQDLVFAAMPRPRADRISPTRKAVNLTVDASLLREARDSGINLSATLERALAEELRQRRRDRWHADNVLAIAIYNSAVDEHGAFADGLRGR